MSLAEGPGVASGKIHTRVMIVNAHKQMPLIFIYIYYRLAEGPGVARGKKYLKNVEEKMSSFLQPITPPATQECSQKNFNSIGL